MRVPLYPRIPINLCLPRSEWQSNQLSGTIPPTMGNLTRLNTLCAPVFTPTLHAEPARLLPPQHPRQQQAERHHPAAVPSWGLSVRAPYSSPSLRTEPVSSSFSQLASNQLNGTLSASMGNLAKVGVLCV